MADDDRKRLREFWEGYYGKLTDAAFDQILQLSNAYRRCFGSVEGAVVLNDLRNRFERRTSLPEDANPNRVLVNEGARLVVLQILAMVEAGGDGSGSGG